MRLRDRITRRLLQTGIRPNTLTVVGLLLNFPVAFAIAGNHLWLGTILFAFASFFDVLDGSVAKSGNKTTPFGAFLDSTLDRISEMVVFGGVAGYFYHDGSGLYIILTLIALGFSLLISYTRARAECIIPSCAVGLAERPERLIVLMLAVLLHSLYAGIWVLLAITFLTFTHRVVYTWYATNKREFPEVLTVMFLDFPRGSKPYDVLLVLTIIILVIGTFL